VGRLLVIVSLVAGCGRIGFGLDPTFDAGSCVPVGHDEDADGVDDACDVCPYLSGDQLDADGDGVGDACDPSSSSVERWALFDPFTVRRSDWNYQNNETFTGDALRLVALTGSIAEALVTPPGRDVFELGGRVNLGGPADRQLALQIYASTGSMSYYYCELYDGGAGLSLRLTYTFDLVTFMNVGTPQAIPGRLDSSAVMMRFEHAPPNMACDATWKGVTYQTSGPIPAGLPADVFVIADTGLDVDLSYFAKISLP
jgi:hypothetical protein